MSDKTTKMTGCAPSFGDDLKYRNLRTLIKIQDDVHDVEALQPIGENKWLYLIRTPLDWTFPKYVIGETNDLNTEVIILHRCGAQWAAHAEWNRILEGGES